MEHTCHFNDHLPHESGLHWLYSFDCSKSPKVLHELSQGFSFGNLWYNWCRRFTRGMSFLSAISSVKALNGSRRCWLKCDTKVWRYLCLFRAKPDVEEYFPCWADFTIKELDLNIWVRSWGNICHILNDGFTKLRHGYNTKMIQYNRLTKK